MNLLEVFLGAWATQRHLHHQEDHASVSKEPAALQLEACSLPPLRTSGSSLLLSHCLLLGERTDESWKVQLCRIYKVATKCQEPPFPSSNSLHRVIVYTQRRWRHWPDGQLRGCCFPLCLAPLGEKGVELNYNLHRLIFCICPLDLSFLLSICLKKIKTKPSNPPVRLKLCLESRFGLCFY